MVMNNLHNVDTYFVYIYELSWYDSNSHNDDKTNRILQIFVDMPIISGVNFALQIALIENIPNRQRMIMLLKRQISDSSIFLDCIPLDRSIPISKRSRNVLWILWRQFYFICYRIQFHFLTNLFLQTNIE